ncbi:MAG: DUF2971 domain-containing protein [Butyrivibrio sp.]|uniref:DUF2971 domain-containing protein n=1 Tax=Butyrivibrio sp. TaxID=28121 RepID=UPI001B4DEAC7|nr:DUF2971 domain-containing protein [Butyrivibrio sp.]MBP3783814.1 DUF2971 domain-containing protein [Butyrivibrio sp.]
MEKPMFVYKYKSIDTKEDLIRLIDIVNNHRIYLPNYAQLNDPLEGEIINIELDGYMGCSLSLMADKEDKYVQACKGEYKILSLSEKPDVSQLWAHYANNYEGVCLCFKTDGAFRKIQAVEYCDNRENVHSEDSKSLTRYVRKSFVKKNKGWQYEKEWRLVLKTQKEYLTFEERELVGIILGHNLSREVVNFIRDNTDERLLKMRTDIGYRTFNINILPLGFRYDFDGTPLKILDVKKTLNRQRYTYYSITDKLR